MCPFIVCFPHYLSQCLSTLQSLCHRALSCLLLSKYVSIHCVFSTHLSQCEKFLICFSYCENFPISTAGMLKGLIRVNLSTTEKHINIDLITQSRYQY